jgi:hypothetical protein
VIHVTAAADEKVRWQPMGGRAGSPAFSQERKRVRVSQHEAGAAKLAHAAQTCLRARFSTSAEHIPWRAGATEKPTYRTPPAFTTGPV